jgi:phosphate transport system permease protein
VPAAVVVGVVASLVSASDLHNLGSAFFGSKWNANTSTYGIQIFVVGSFLTAVPALVLSLLIGLGIAIASTTYLPKFLTAILDPFVDLLAGIPSIIYGLWGYILLAPIFGSIVQPWAVEHLSFLPGFRAPASVYAQGVGLPLAIVILTLMSLPITTLLIRDALRSVPRDLVESGLALGATRWETVRKISMRHGSRGLWSAAFLGFGRAFGETVAVAMVLGAATQFPTSVFSQTDTMAAFMFDNLDGALATPGEIQALAELAILLLVITLVVNIVGRRFVSALYTQEVAGL